MTEQEMLREWRKEIAKLRRWNRIWNPISVVLILALSAWVAWIMYAQCH